MEIDDNSIRGIGTDFQNQHPNKTPPRALAGRKTVDNKQPYGLIPPEHTKLTTHQP
jgi:hypothetical protein